MIELFAAIAYCHVPKSFVSLTGALGQDEERMITVKTFTE